MSDSILNKKAENCVSHDPEYDDTLGVPDSLEITINESENINSNNDTDNSGKFMTWFVISVLFN